MSVSRQPSAVYVGPLADSSRWHVVEPRDDDIVITTPSKSGTTLMQNLVGTLVFGRSDFGTVSEISVWVDLQVRSERELAETLAAQTHRRFLKTHTPLDGLPRPPGVTFIAVVRHPLDVALSRFDHRANQDHVNTERLRQEAVGSATPASGRGSQPTEPADFVRWWIDNDMDHRGIGGLGLADLCRQAAGYWNGRNDAAVHLFHYDDLWDDLAGQLRRLATILGVDASTADVARWADECSFDAMRDRASESAPEAHLGMWADPRTFFSQGGRRNWAELLTPAEVDRFHDRVATLAGDAAPWLLGRRTDEAPL